MNTTTPQTSCRRLLRLLTIALSAALMACGSGDADTATNSTAPTEAPTEAAAPSSAEATERSTVPETEASLGDPSDPDTEAGVAYCAALDDFFTAQNRVITEGVQSDEATWAEIIGELDAVTPVATSAAPENHEPILTGFGDVVSRMAELSYAEFEAHPTINDEAADWFFGELFIISSHASEICLIDTSFDVEIDIEPEPPLDAEWSATCEAIDETDFRVLWTNETGTDVAVSGDVIFASSDGVDTQSSFDMQVILAGEQVAHRSFSFDGTGDTCEVARLDAFPVADSIFFEPAQPGDTCTLDTSDDGSLAATVEAVALRDGDVRTEVAFYDNDGVRVSSIQFFSLEVIEGDTATMTNPYEDELDDAAVRCEVVGRFDF